MKYTHYTLADLAKIKYGKNQKKVLSELGNIPIYGTGGIMGYATDALYDKPSVLIGRKGTINKVKYIEQPFWTVDTLFYTEVNENLVIPKFLYYVMSLLNLDNYNEGTTIPSLRTETLYRLEFDIPSLQDQERILSILKSLDDKIEVNSQINKNLLAQKDSLYKNWFIDFAPFGKQKPANWENKAFKDILISRTEKSSDITLSMFSVTDNGIFPRDEKFNKKLSTSSTKNKVIYKNDLVFGMSREILNWGIMKEAKGAVSSAYNVFKVATDINIKYLEGFIKYHPKYFHDIIKPASREGQGIDKNALFGKEIYLPTTKVLEDFYSIDDTLSFTIDNNIAENIRLSNIRDAVLPKLMSGEIDVSEIDI